MRHVGVDAEGVEMERDAGAVAGDDCAFDSEHARLLCGFFDRERGAGDAAGGEGAVGLVAAVGEGFADDSDAGGAGGGATLLLRG